MLDMGFIPDIRRILDAPPRSAPERSCSRRRSPTRSGASSEGDPRTTRQRSRWPPGTRPPRVRQVVYPVDRERKEALLAHLIASRRPAPGPGLHPDQARGVAPGLRSRPARLRRDGDPLGPHAGRSGPGRSPASRRARSRSWSRPTSRSRGLDIEELPVVVNFELPWQGRGLHPPHRPDGPGRRERRSRSASSASTRSDLLRAIQRLLQRRSRSGGRGLRARSGDPAAPHPRPRRIPHPGAPPQGSPGASPRVTPVAGPAPDGRRPLTMAGSPGPLLTAAGIPRGSTRFMSRPRIGILTGGGDVPGLNSVIKSVTYRSTELGYEVIGLRRGWEALTHMRPGPDLDPDYVRPLDRMNTRTIDRTGGTFLHSRGPTPRRCAPASCPPSSRPTACRRCRPARGSTTSRPSSWRTSSGSASTR